VSRKEKLNLWRFNPGWIRKEGSEVERFLVWNQGDHNSYRAKAATIFWITLSTISEDLYVILYLMEKPLY
jgi:hypothetical protein